MQHIPRLFASSKRGKSMDPKKNPRKPRLERRNAVKYIDYNAAASSSSSSLDSPSPSSSSSSSSFLVTRSLDLSDKTSFRIEGTDGELDQIYGILGLSGPEDFGIPVDAWEKRKVRSSSDLHPRSRLYPLDSPDSWDREVLEAAAADLCKRVEDSAVIAVTDLCKRVDDSAVIAVTARSAELCTRVDDSAVIAVTARSADLCTRVDDSTVMAVPARSESIIVAKSSGSFAGGGGIRGLRPPLLKPPPSMRLPEIDHTSSTWDIFRDFAPEGAFGNPIEESASEEEEEVEVPVVEEQEDNKVAMSETGSFTTSNDDDSSSSTTEPSNISPNVRFRRNISSWQKGALLGRGSFGSVYEGIADDGFFFAVKEVSLLDQGDQGRQSIIQLEQEIFLLSQFEHENIVQYLGTDKDDSHLYIFLELVTQGSLQKLYHSYHLDSQVSSYTRQILHGLKYLHDQNVVHRDIKCANILVSADGSVKLSDFGLAKATKLNDVRSCKGTACWMAPEVVNRKNQGYGLPADIWSLGCTVLEMLTRKIPYSELEWMTALYKIGKGTLPTVPESLPTDAIDFIMSCLKVDPNLRPSAGQLLEHPFVNRLLPTTSGSLSPYVSGPRTSST